MAGERKDGGSAFPLMPPTDAAGQSAAGYPYPEMGMSLCDWFAGQMLAGMGAEVIRMASEDGVKPEEVVAGAEGMAAIAYAVAKAMLVTREKSFGKA